MKLSRISTKAYVLVDVDVDFTLDGDGEVEIHKITLDNNRGENVTDDVTDGSYDSILDDCDTYVKEFWEGGY